MRGAHLAVGLVATIPPLALSRSGGPSVWLAALAVAGGAELARLAARRWSPALARSYLVRRALSFRYLGPAFGLPLASAALVAHAGAIGATAVVALHLGLAHAWRARLTRPGALRVVLPLAAVGGLFVALEALAVSGYDWRLGGRLAYAEESRRQRLVLVEREGALDLFLDGELQLRTTDEQRYHDGLVGPVLAASAHPRRVLVMGGGDGFAARDLLKHPSVERVLIVDWDPAVTRLFRCEPELSSLNEGALDDPRVELRHRDVREVLTAPGEPFDLRDRGPHRSRSRRGGRRAALAGLLRDGPPPPSARRPRRDARLVARGRRRTVRGPGRAGGGRLRGAGLRARRALFRQRHLRRRLAPGASCQAL
ncbi:MAG: hypothetical protein QM820_36250 [Minicystis sp.]